MKNVPTLLTFSILALAACSGGEEANEEPMTEPMGSPAVMAPIGTVTITEPRDGGTVRGANVTVRLTVNGFALAPAGELTPGTGHHHLYLDADLSPLTAPVPSVPGSIVHMGDASASYTFQGVTPGQHRLIAVVADGVHVPLNPPVMDTVTFTVQ